MSKYLKKYTIELETVGPVHVGSGQQLSKKEYIFLDGHRTVGVLDTEKFYLYVKSQKLESSYEDYFIGDNRLDLYSWIKNNNINVNAVRKYLKYEMPNSDTEMLHGMQIMTNIKDPYGNPYIPGSSLKGMLRTILLSWVVLQKPAEYRFDINAANGNIGRNKYLKREIESIESKAFRNLKRPDTKDNDAVNDMLSGMIISDSYPLKISACSLFQKVERKVNGMEERLNLLRECVNPGVKIKFDMTIDESLCKFTGKDIMDAVNAFDEMYYRDFASKFRGESPVCDTVFLGGGSGFVSKTVIYPIFGQKECIDVTKEIFMKTNVPREHGHYKDDKLGVSPHVIKYSYYHGRPVQFGKCKIETR